MITPAPKYTHILILMKHTSENLRHLFPCCPARAGTRIRARGLDGKTIALGIAFDFERFLRPEGNLAIPLPPATGRAFFLFQSDFLLHEHLARLPPMTVLLSASGEKKRRTLACQTEMSSFLYLHNLAKICREQKLSGISL